MVKLSFAGSGGAGTVREYLAVVVQNGWVAVAAGVVICQHTQLLIRLLHDHGDEMDVRKMRPLMLQLADEMESAQQAAGVTSNDMQQIALETATTAGEEAVARRVDAVLAKVGEELCSRPGCAGPMGGGKWRQRNTASTGFKAAYSVDCSSVGVDVVGDATCSGGVGVHHPQSSENTDGVKPAVKSNKRLRKNQRRREQAALTVAIHEAAVEAVVAVVATTDDVAEVFLGGQLIADVSDTVVDQDVLAATLAAAMAKVVLMKEAGSVASPLAVCGVPATTTSEFDAVYYQQAYDAEHIVENSNSSRLVAVASAGTLADAVVGSGECVDGNVVSSYQKSCGDKFGSTH